MGVEHRLLGWNPGNLTARPYGTQLQLKMAARRLWSHHPKTTGLTSPLQPSKVALRTWNQVPYGLAVRIPGFHPGGPGSTPGMGICVQLHLLQSSFAIKQLTHCCVKLQFFSCPLDAGQRKLFLLKWTGKPQILSTRMKSAHSFTHLSAVNSYFHFSNVCFYGNMDI